MGNPIQSIGARGVAVSATEPVKPSGGSASPADTVLSELSQSCQETLTGILMAFSGGTPAAAFGSAQAKVYSVGKAFAHLPERVREELVAVAQRTFPHRADMQNKMIADLTLKLEGDPLLDGFRKNRV